MAGMALLAALAGTPAALGQPAAEPKDPPAPADQPPIQPPSGQPATPPATPPAGESPKTPPAAEPKAEPPAEAKKPEAAPAPAPDPTKSRAIDDVAKEQDSSKKDPGPIAPRRNNPPVGGRPSPVRPAIPAPKIGVDDIGVPTGGRYGEGKFLLRRTGTLVKAPTGEWVFAFAKSTASKKERPAILLPCAKLTQLEAQIGAAGQPDPKDKATPYPDSLVTITGEVFNYLGREYILLSLFSVAPNTPAAAEPTPAPAKAAAAPGTSEPSAMDVADPSVEELIKDLQQRRGSSEARALAPTAPPQPKKPASEPVVVPPPQAGLVAEGTVLAAKRGRIVRLRGGELAFSIDNDAASASQPLVLLPCRTLERMEQLFWSRGDATVIELSGRTTIYKGRNYVLPTSFLLPVPSELRPMQ
jgi:hypothetical protein